MHTFVCMLRICAYLCEHVDIGALVDAPVDGRASPRSSVELDAQQAEVVAKRALLCWKHAEQLQPKAKVPFA